MNAEKLQAAIKEECVEKQCSRINIQKLWVGRFLSTQQLEVKCCKSPNSLLVDTEVKPLKSACVSSTETSIYACLAWICSPLSWFWNWEPSNSFSRKICTSIGWVWAWFAQTPCCLTSSSASLQWLCARVNPVFPRSLLVAQPSQAKDTCGSVTGDFKVTVSRLIKQSHHVWHYGAHI